MNEPTENPELFEVTRLKPRSLARGLPVPPVVPLLAILCIAFGLSLGYGLASKPAPTAAPTPALIPTLRLVAAASPSPSASIADASVAPTGGQELPPTGGYTLAQALEALKATTDFPPDVISARAAHYPSVASGWVWLIVVPYTVQDCGGKLVPDPTAAPSGVESAVPSAAAAAAATTTADCPPLNTTEMIVIDYQTGEFLEDRIPAS